MTLQPAEPWSPAATQQPAEPWKPTTLHLRAVVGGLGLALLAVAGHRPDLVVLATPLLIIACWGAACRPTAVHAPRSWGREPTWSRASGTCAVCGEPLTTVGSPATPSS